MTILDESLNASEPDAAGSDDHAAKLARLRAAAQIGLDQLARGEGIEITDVDAFFRKLEAEVEAEFE